MLAQCIGRQRAGWLRATHKKIADKLGVERSNVTRALGRLEGWHMLQRVDTGLTFVNPVRFQKSRICADLDIRQLS
ncbi:hypothetical protein ACWGPD_08765 [Streptomyces hirsutus]|uniref:hypothetical protein n=1 Tax=Streptomyces hirsutus TaxID=35620 RepID=UPI00332D9884